MEWVLIFVVFGMDVIDEKDFMFFKEKIISKEDIKDFK